MVKGHQFECPACHDNGWLHAQAFAGLRRLRSVEHKLPFDLGTAQVTEWVDSNGQKFTTSIILGDCRSANKVYCELISVRRQQNMML